MRIYYYYLFLMYFQKNVHPVNRLHIYSCLVHHVYFFFTVNLIKPDDVPILLIMDCDKAYIGYIWHNITTYEGGIRSFSKSHHIKAMPNVNKDASKDNDVVSCSIG